MKILILGAGLVGGPMALDLAADPEYSVTSVDINGEALTYLTARWEQLASGRRNMSGSLHIVQADLSDSRKVKELADDHDLVISAVPGFMGFKTLETVIRAGKNVVDIAFFIEDPFELDELARKMNVTAIMDMGVAPGMCNVLIGYASHLLDTTEEILYMVGGLPVVRTWPWEYKAVFSPVDVIEEYTRPARYIENGIAVTKPALSDPELIDFPGVGTLEAFNTDGLRSLAHTISCPNMKEKTLRYPGHIEKMRILRDTGFFSQEPLVINGQAVRPMDLTARLLFPKWKLNDGEADITVMQVMVKGMKQGKKVTYTWDLFDTLDRQTGIHSMARTTGYSATMALRMIAAGLYSRKGVSVPEYVGMQPECVKYLLNGLAGRGVIYKETIS